MDTERVRMFGRASLRGAAVSGMAGAALYAFVSRAPAWVSWLLDASPLAPLETVGPWCVAAVLGLGALAAVVRVAAPPRSIGGAICVWSALALTFLAVPLMIWPCVRNLVYADAVLVFCLVALLGALLGLVDLGLEAAVPTHAHAARGALLGAAVCVGYGLIDVTAALLVEPTLFTRLPGDDFDAGLRDGVRTIVTALAVCGGLLGFFTVAVHAWVPSRSHWGRMAGRVVLVVVLWGFVPTLLYACWYLCATGESSVSLVWVEVASVLLRGMGGNVVVCRLSQRVWDLRPMVPLLLLVALHGLGLGGVFTVLWTRWGARRRFEVPAPPPAPARRHVLLALAALAAVSLAWQVHAARLPLERLRAGQARVVPVVALLDLEPSKTVRPALLFSPDSSTLWVRVGGDGFLGGWRIRPSSSDWKPDSALMPAGSFAGIPRHEERAGRWLDATAHRRVPNGEEITSSLWRREALSPDGTVSATLTHDGAVVRETRTGTVLATLYILSDHAWAAVAPDGRCNGVLRALKIVDGNWSMPVPSDYPLLDPTLLPRAH